MALQDYGELAAAGRAFREEAFTDEFIAGVGPHVQDLPNTVLGRYASVELFYAASPLEAPTIPTEGITPGFQLIDPEDEEFFSGQFAEQQFRGIDPNDQIVVNSFVFGRKPDGTPKDIVLTQRPEEFDLSLYGVPERLVFYMRNLGALANLSEADPEARRHAEELIRKYTGRLASDGLVDVSLFGVNNHSPAVARSYLHPSLCAFDMEQGVEIMESLARRTRVEVPGAILPEHVSPDSTYHLDSGPIMRRILMGDSMVVFRPSN